MLTTCFINQESIKVEGVSMIDYPKFSDAFVTEANYKDGTPLEESEIQELNEFEKDFINEVIHSLQLY